MFNQGSGSNGEWTFLDILSIVNFAIGLQNLDMNIDQSDLEGVVRDIHAHLQMQDQKIDEILRRLDNDNRRDIPEDK